MEVNLLSLPIRTYLGVTFGFSESDYNGEEGSDASIPVKVEKREEVRLAHAVTLVVTPLTVREASEEGFEHEFENEDPHSPNRASNKSSCIEMAHKDTYIVGNYVTVYLIGKRGPFTQKLLGLMLHRNVQEPT